MSGYKKLQKSFRSCSKKIEKRASLFQAFRQGYIYNFLYRKKETNQQFRKGGRAFTRHFTDHGLFIHLLKVCMLWMSIPEGWCGLSSRTLKNKQNISNAKRSTYLEMYIVFWQENLCVIKLPVCKPTSGKHNLRVENSNIRVICPKTR